MTATISKADAEELTQTLGQIAGGAWRQIALAKRMGVPEALGLSVDEWVQQRLGGYIKMAVEDRRPAVKELDAEGYTQREIGKILGVDQATVSRDLNSSDANTSEEESPVAEDEDFGELGDANASEEESLGSFRGDRRAETASPCTGRAENSARALRQALNTGVSEWNTPITIIERARAVLGGIDLDPASSPSGQRIVRAARFFTEQDDGLKHDWRGRVWLNPPYAQPAIAYFVSKLVAEYQADNVTAAILLTNDCCDTIWFHQAVRAARAVCFPQGRLAFTRPDGTPGSPLQGQTFFYFGDDVKRFTAEFEGLGVVMAQIGGTTS